MRMRGVLPSRLACSSSFICLTLHTVLVFFYLWCCIREDNWNSLVDIVTQPLAGPSGVGVRYPAGVRGLEVKLTAHTHPVQCFRMRGASLHSRTSPSFTVGTVSSFRGWSSRNVALTTHPHLTSRLKRLVKEGLELYLYTSSAPLCRSNSVLKWAGQL
jgi:hypothetical protein